MQIRTYNTHGSTPNRPTQLWQVTYNGDRELLRFVSNICFLLVLCLAVQVSAYGADHETDKNKAAAVTPIVNEAPPVSRDARALLDQVNRRIHNINTAELQQLLKTQPQAVLIDVRTEKELTLLGGSIDAPRHFNIVRGWLEFQIDSYVPRKDTPIVVYCGVNQRSPLAADALMKLGYTNVKNYADGFFAWKKAGLPVEERDRALDSFLYSKPIEVAPGVWSAIGATAPPTYDNSGHNNNLSFVITDDGVVVVNGGDNYLLAQALHQQISRITDQPVKAVVLENAQGHAMLGASYWQEQGAVIIAHEDAAEIIRTKGQDILQRMQKRSRDKAFKTRVAIPDKTFKDKMVLQMGTETIELLYLGPAHSPGDVMVWLPAKKLVIAGDMAFHKRMLPVFSYTDTGEWIKTWDKFAALNAEIVIPGHGGPTNMQQVTTFTRDYLVYMRSEVEKTLDAGGGLEDAYEIDQSAYAHLHTFFELNRSNAGQIFRAMEFE